MRCARVVRDTRDWEDGRKHCIEWMAKTVDVQMICLNFLCAALQGYFCRLVYDGLQEEFEGLGWSVLLGVTQTEWDERPRRTA